MHTLRRQRSVSPQSAAHAFDRRVFLGALAAFSGVALSADRFALAADKVGPDAKLLKSMREKGVNFLKTVQSEDGSWTTNTQPGVAAMVCCGLEAAGVKGDDPALQKGLKFLLNHLQKDGGIYHPESHHRNYETSLTVLALAGVEGKGEYQGVIKDAEKYLRSLQWDETKEIDKSHPSFGGAGYGGKNSRPDLSNTGFMLDALKAAGIKEDDPAMKNALIFVSRCQNLESEHNTTEFAAKVNDGGFYYAIAGSGASPAGKTADGGLRSYAGMTYTGLKSMLYAGLSKDDKRVKAAMTWIRKFYSVDENPGLGQSGLFYYYHVFAKTLATLDVDLFEDDKGVKHDWRKELTEALAQRQKDNGSWVNGSDRWMEADPSLATAFALLALKYCDPK